MKKMRRMLHVRDELPLRRLKAGPPDQGRMLKCDFCRDSGGEPSCVKACPKKAIWIEEVES